MTKKKPFSHQNEFTIMHNTLIDHLMPELSGSAWKVLTVIVRKTVGWHKEHDELSFSQIKQLTGIKTNTTVSEALKDLEKMGVIKVDRPDLSGEDPARFWKSNIYSLNLDFEVEIEAKEEPPPVQEMDNPSPKNGLPPSPIFDPPLVQKIDTQNKGSSLNKDSFKEGHNPSPPISVKVYKGIARLYPDKTLWEGIAEVVGEDEISLRLWRDVVTAYIGCGYNKRNLNAMLEYFQRGEIPTTKKKGKGDRKNGQRTNGTGKRGVIAEAQARARGEGEHADPAGPGGVQGSRRGILSGG